MYVVQAFFLQRVIFVFAAVAHILIGFMDLLRWLLVSYIVLGWLVMFGILKNRDGAFFKIYILLMSWIEPILELIRRVVPAIGGFDFSPIIIFFGLHLAKFLVIRIINMLAYVFGY